MSVYGELDSTVKHRTQFAFKGKGEHIAKVHMLNIAYPKQHMNIKTTDDSRDRVIVPDTVKITFNFELESTDKTRSFVNNVSRALVKKKVVILGSKDFDTISNSDVDDTYKDLYLRKKGHEEKLLQGTQPANGLKVDSTALPVTTQENDIKKEYDKRYAIPLGFDFFKHPMYPYGFKEDLTVKLELNS